MSIYSSDNKETPDNSGGKTPARSSPTLSYEGRIIGGRFASSTSGLSSRRTRSTRSWIWELGFKKEKEGKPYWVCNKCKVLYFIYNICPVLFYLYLYCQVPLYISSHTLFNCKPVISYIL